MTEDFNNIKNVLENALTENNYNPQDFSISYEKIKGIPEEIVCYKKRLGWYYYLSDERNYGLYRGPYDYNGFIQVLSFKLPLSEESIKKIEQEYYSKEMAEGKYFDNKIFRTLEEIDQYEKECF